jgi:TonB family protein
MPQARKLRVIENDTEARAGPGPVPAVSIVPANDTSADGAASNAPPVTISIIEIREPIAVRISDERVFWRVFGFSLLLHAAIVAVAMWQNPFGEERAAGGTDELVTIEGVTVEMVDSLPSEGGSAATPTEGKLMEPAEAAPTAEELATLTEETDAVAEVKEAPAAAPPPEPEVTFVPPETIVAGLFDAATRVGEANAERANDALPPSMSDAKAVSVVDTRTAEVATESPASPKVQSAIEAEAVPTDSAVPGAPAVPNQTPADTARAIASAGADAAIGEDRLQVAAASVDAVAEKATAAKTVAAASPAAVTKSHASAQDSSSQSVDRVETTADVGAVETASDATSDPTAAVADATEAAEAQMAAATEAFKAEGPLTQHASPPPDAAATVEPAKTRTPASSEPQPAATVVSTVQATAPPEPSSVAPTGSVAPASAQIDAPTAPTVETVAAATQPSLLPPAPSENVAPPPQPVSIAEAQPPAIVAETPPPAVEPPPTTTAGVRASAAEDALAPDPLVPVDAPLPRPRPAYPAEVAAQQQQAEAIPPVVKKQPPKPTRKVAARPPAAVGAASSPFAIFGSAGAASAAQTGARGPTLGLSGGGGTSRTAKGRATLASYQSMIFAHLQKFKRYPPEARRRGIQGTATVSFVIDASGRLVSVSLVASSGAAILDSEAVALVRRAVPYPPMPPGTNERQITVRSFPVRFGIR